ncbi:amino acid transporter [Rhizodiscina lignyota]|uniref:Amino acid transporter n=1 Tax=Rhizodiscina lignyota TaxID=1504668 RepID=A0A9P4I6R4_9PEZI|nr:amino acid transporter [Rhizodiscina lignyota]
MTDREISMIMNDMKPDDNYSKTLRVGEVPFEDVESKGVYQADGANPQQLQRYIRFVAAVNFSCTILCSWEALAVTFQFALFNGGPASMVYGCILVGFGATAVGASLAELASIDPTVGAQYRWSANLAPFAPKFWGLIQGWVTVFAWIMACAGPPAIIANMMTALASFCHPDYEVKNWHTMLIMWGLICVPFFFNLYFRQLLNAFEIFGGLFHFLFFLVWIIVLVTLARRSTTDYVFKTLTTGVSGWNNPGVCWGLGLLTVTFPLSGADAVLHMSDEVKNVQVRAPHSILIAVISNAVMLFAFVICLLFTIGDVQTVSAAPLPIIEVFYGATHSKAGTVILVTMPALILFVALFNAFASVSRLVWAFAKDNGLPFSKTFAYVHPKLMLPLNALGLIGVISFLLSIVYVISSTAFNAIISLQTMALSVSYCLPICFVMIRKIQGRPPVYGSYRIGKLGVLVNLFALLYLIYVILWMPFPTVLPVTAGNFNYAGPILGAVLVGAVLDYVISGRNRFHVPVAPKRM